MASHSEPLNLAAPELEDEKLDDVRWRPSPGALRNIIATVLVGIAIAALVWVFDRPDVASSQSVTVTASASGAAPEIGKPAPDFTLTMTDGTQVHLSDFKGKPVWINFWASWCPPCRAENPDVQDLYNEHKDADGLVLLAPAIGEGRDSITGYMQRADLHYPVGADSDTQIAANYRVMGIPTHIFVDRDGIIRDMRIGAMSRKTMEKKLAEIIGTQP
jgi:cytochrome c biogenesis protein CcmG/thiol:disulfide interchange protein DsbE